MELATPAKGNDEQRATWKQWARRNSLMDINDNFRHTEIIERRRVYRTGLKQQDVKLIGMIEGVLINLVHYMNGATERWPETIRVMLNNASVGGGETRPFESWVGPQGLEKRKQATRVWTELIQYLVLEYHVNNITWSGDTMTIRGDSGYLPDVGLALSDDQCDDIMDIISGRLYGTNFVKENINTFCMNVIMQENPTPRNNPLLFWVAVLLQTEEFGVQPRLAFSDLNDELTMQEKLEALVHYARVFIIDHAFMCWPDSMPEEWRTTITTALNTDVGGWCDGKIPRPIEREGDPADFGQPHWQAFKTHFDGLRKKWLVKGSNSPIGVILELL